MEAERGKDKKLEIERDLKKKKAEGGREIGRENGIVEKRAEESERTHGGDRKIQRKRGGY